MLKLHLQLIAALQNALETLDASARKLLAPIQERAALLTTMPGVSDIVAQAIVAEIGVDILRFPSAADLVSWAGLCPRNDERAGKRHSTRVRKSGAWLKTTLVTSAPPTSIAAAAPRPFTASCGASATSDAGSNPMRPGAS
jgi:transposase